MPRNLLFLVLFISGHVASAGEPSPWSTYRGNIQRTGNTDGKPGPAKPTLVWVLKSQDHFIASPVPAGTNIIFSGLGAFNRPSMIGIPIEARKVVEPAWVRTSPFLKLPTVSSPAIFDDKMVFGDGMHQTDGAVLYCVPSAAGFPLWQLPIPGELVHLEGSPVIRNAKVYIGGGAAGVMCVDLLKASVNAKEFDLPGLALAQAEKWKELKAKYEVDKKKDPDFAIPPSEDQLLKAVPKVFWKQGEKKWHVDAPINVVDRKVLVASAFLEKEKVGDRALHCLNADTGEPIWRAELGINPWGGPSVDGNVVVVTGSTISYDPKLLKGARGIIAAFELDTGKPLWKKEFPGGILGCAALAQGLAIFTCTDGKVRGLSLKDGERRFLYDAKAPIFAPPAVVAQTVYVADLKGIVHAIDSKTGTLIWQFNVGSDPAVQAPGMVYGGILVHGGQLFLATCNLDGPNAQKATCAVCIGSK